MNLNPRILHESKYLSIEYFPTQHAFVMVWQGYTNDDVYKSSVDKIISLMEAYDITKTLHDLRQHKALSTEARDYATKRSLDFGKRNWNVKRAIVLSKDIFSKFSTENFVKSVTEKAENQHREFFENLEDAKDWLFDL